MIKVNCTQVADPKAIYRSILEKSRRYAGGLLANAERELEGILFSNGPMTYVSFTLPLLLLLSPFITSD